MESERIPEDHPRNPAKILSNISESYYRIFQNCLEYNALTNMGLCLYQDFFVTKTIYLTDRGALNVLALLSFSILSSLIAMIYFRSVNKIKYSDHVSYTSK